MWLPTLFCLNFSLRNKNENLEVLIEIDQHSFLGLSRMEITSFDQVSLTGQWISNLKLHPDLSQPRMSPRCLLNISTRMSELITALPSNMLRLQLSVSPQLREKAHEASLTSLSQLTATSCTRNSQGSLSKQPQNLVTIHHPQSRVQDLKSLFLWA